MIRRKKSLTKGKIRGTVKENRGWKDKTDTRRRKKRREEDGMGKGERKSDEINKE